jgi:hypothetical protein
MLTGLASAQELVSELTGMLTGMLTELASELAGGAELGAGGVDLRPLAQVFLQEPPQERSTCTPGGDNQPLGLHSGRRWQTSERCCDPLSVEGVGDDGSDSGSIGEKRQAASTPSPPPPPAETVDEVENGFEHIVLTEEQHIFCPECGDLLHTTTSGERFCNNVDCDNEVLFVLDA